MYPFSFDEILMAQGLDLNVEYKKKATSEEPLTDKAHKDLVEQIRTFYLVGGMPAAVTEWVESHSYIEVSHVHTDIIQTYEDDFNKYKKRVSPVLLRQVLRSVALQVGNKFVYSLAARDVHSFFCSKRGFAPTDIGWADNASKAHRWDWYSSRG